MVEPEVCQAVTLAAEEQCGGLCVVDVPVQALGVGRGGDALDLIVCEPLGKVGLLGADDGQCKDEPLRGADRVGIVEVEHAVHEDHRIGSGAVGAAQDGAEVTRLLDAFEHEE